MVFNEGGSVLYGWNIALLPTLWAEAEFHAVWRNPKGDLIDVTPKETNEGGIVFLPDPNAVYEGIQVNNRFKALSTDSIVQRHIELSNLIFEEMNQGSMKGHVGLFLTTPKLQELLFEREQNLMKIVRKYGIPRPLT